MSTAALLALLVVIGLVTFVYRYAMIGLFAKRSLPGWLHAAGGIGGEPRR